MRSNIQTMQELVTEVDRREAAKADYVVPTGQIRMRDDSALIFGGATYPLTDHAHGQVATFTGIPKRYYDKMAEVSGLRSHNVNAWMDAAGARRMVRTLDGKARALVSDRFRPIDNFLMVRAFLPVLDEFPDARFQTQALSETRMYLQVTFPKLSGEVRQGDVVQYGLTLSNSEVGAGSVDVKSLVWRLVCQNGMVGQSIVNRRHVGARIGADGSAFEEFADDTIQAEIKSFQLRLRDAMRAAVTEQAFADQLAKMREAAGEEIAKPNDVIENVTKRYSWLTDEASEAMLANMVRERDFSRWGLVNSVTALAHGTDDADQQFEYERLGNELLTLPRSQWREIAA
jgi:hypothetical protein